MRNSHPRDLPKCPHSQGKQGLKALERDGEWVQAPPSSLSPLIPPDLPMQQNMALFEFNGQSGYLLKHEFMRRLDKQFNPFSVDSIDVVVATTLSITARPGADQRLGGAGLLRRKA